MVLVPVGDDFRYKTTYEGAPTFINYGKIIEHINSRSSELKAHVR